MRIGDKRCIDIQCSKCPLEHSKVCPVKCIRTQDNKLKMTLFKIVSDYFAWKDAPESVEQTFKNKLNKELENE